MRFPILLAAALLLLAGCEKPMRQTASDTPRLDMARLDKEIGAIADRARPGVLGVGLMNLESGETWLFNGDLRFPMQSVFKAPLGAAVLGEVDAGRLGLDQVVSIEEKDISPAHSPIADAWPARRDYTVRELLVAAVGGSDNTAADVLMKLIGGPGAVTTWLADHHVNQIRIDRYERELQPQSVGLDSFRIAWKGDEAYRAAMDAVPPAERRAAMNAYLADDRDTASPRGILTYFYVLDQERLLSPASLALLMKIMTETQTGAARLKAGFPPGSAFAHKTGASRTDLGVNLATNDIGIVTLPDGRRYAVAVFLKGATLDGPGREAIHADVARAITRGVR
jgi:beta-lactamase class A